MKEGVFMEVRKIVTGPLEENCYVLKQNHTCLVIDPGDDANLIKEQIEGDKVLAVLLTHSHFDHIGALRDIIGKKNIPILKGRILEEKEYTYGDFTFEVIKTPGHSNDSVTYYFKSENKMFTGDFLFKESIGRCDLPTGNLSDMKESLKKIRTYDKTIELYPGHGENSILEQELENNPYLKEVEGIK